MHPVDPLNVACHRRAFLGQGLQGLGAVALAQLLSSGHERRARAALPSAATAARRAKARAVILLFQHGGPSQMDLFDPKPELTARHGQPYPGSLEVHFHKQQGNLLASPFQFSPAGQCGMQLCELLPETARVADHLTLIRSMTTESVDHEASLRLIHTGKIQAGRPCWPSWALYGLGSESENLPAYVVLPDPGGLPIDGVRNWSSGWLPAELQGTPLRASGSPVLHLARPEGVSLAAQRRQLDLVRAWNESHRQAYPENHELTARIAQFEMAARMQTAIPEALDLADETAETRALYGLDTEATAEYGTRCLIARRLVERGVRFVQLYLHNQPWDTHSKNSEQLRSLCGRADRPSAALVEDLRRRGMLDSTIVVWTGEFGRLPISQGSDGRDHNRHAFTTWVAGGGFRPGHVHGATDEFGYRAVEKPVSVHDFHATLLAALGLDHQRLTFPYDGRDDSLTDSPVTDAQVVDELLA